MTSRVRIVCPDPSFAEAVGSRLRGRGLSVAVERDPDGLTPSRVRSERVDLVLLAVPEREERPLRWLSSMKRALPALEVILLNLAGEMRVSLAGMRAGASSELGPPFDVAILRRTVSAALRRRKRRSLAERLERAMSAAAFAEAGEPETARELLAAREEEEP